MNGTLTHTFHILYVKALGTHHTYIHVHTYRTLAQVVTRTGGQCGGLHRGGGLTVSSGGLNEGLTGSERDHL